MPRGNGTGPLGIGPRTGRRRGWCNNGGMQYGGLGQFAFRGRNGWLFGLAAPIVVAIIRDIASPTGLLRQLVAAFLPGKRIKYPQHILCETEYSVLDQKSVKPDLKKGSHQKEGIENE